MKLPAPKFEMPRYRIRQIVPVLLLSLSLALRKTWIGELHQFCYSVPDSWHE
jgi:hypothetical protein